MAIVKRKTHPGPGPKDKGFARMGLVPATFAAP